MKIATKVVIDIATGEVLEREEFDYEGPLELLGRSSQGKHQEVAAVDSNTKMRDQDYAARDVAVGQERGAIGKLEANPGYTPQDLTSMRAENAQGIDAIYGNENEQARRAVASTGSAGSAGLIPQMRSTDDLRARTVAMGDNNIAGRQANAALTTRRMLPSMYGNIGSLYNGSVANFTGANANMIDSRMQADQSKPIWQSLTETALTAAAGSKGLHS
ncbi:MAG: hypothetical protein M3O09_15935 [Acidobacteriota bacterium]|nr:hypothetical protein [Acidobacteriota bacterium]